jgi:hypothetical protein
VESESCFLVGREAEVGERERFCRILREIGKSERFGGLQNDENQ